MADIRRESLCFTLTPEQVEIVMPELLYAHKNFQGDEKASSGLIIAQIVVPFIYDGELQDPVECRFRFIHAEASKAVIKALNDSEIEP